ncbi:exonuclease domain-containing protein [Streptomyces sp. NRRL S-350]|uniref:exonuclease domain-containing protein n=1 Tax=Streptomyces sp. NRRL S-350 TaxID=1463902 RepID=UPI000691536B|nr:exonuclease domain-containing protein [Streptomyces sp. NRRL S-350]
MPTKKQSPGPWPNGPLAGFDLESTGVDVETDRIVTGCVLHLGGGGPVRTRTWLSDLDGAVIPEQASAIHGIRTEVARESGDPAARVVEEIVTALAECAQDGRPLVAMNAPFDLSLLDREARRHGVVPLSEREYRPLILDLRVLDKQVDPYRTGPRTLGMLCRHYEVQHHGAHHADADALAAVEVTLQLAHRHQWLGRIEPDRLHEMQVGWARSQALSLASYFRRQDGDGRRADTVRTEWPLIPAGVAA